MKIIKVPQRADYAIDFKRNGQILTINMGGVKEKFDFTNCEDGYATDIKVEHLPVNPILSAEKKNGKVTVKVLRFYTFEEKELFENGHN